MQAQLQVPLDEAETKSIEPAAEDVIVILDDKLYGSSPPSQTPSWPGSRATSINSQMDHTHQSSDSATHTSNGTHSNFQYSDSTFLPYTPRHSDFTIPTSNAQPVPTSEEPSVKATGPELPRRSIFGNAVQRKYKTDLRTDEESKWEENDVELKDDFLFGRQDDDAVSDLPTDGRHLYHRHVNVSDAQHRANFMSEVSLPDFREHRPGWGEKLYLWTTQITSWCSSSSTETTHRKSSDLPAPGMHREKSRRKRPHETIHAQSLLLGLAFCAVWSANNVMAPNLTEMAEFFGLEGAAERDLYLGSYCALATGVFSSSSGSPALGPWSPPGRPSS